jgi:predicted TIM-barrel fold metal-dependent hydrolase
VDVIPIIDAHHHLWDLGHFSYPWLSKRPLPASVAGDVVPIAQNYLLSDYLHDGLGQNLIKSVHVDAGMDPLHPVTETRWLQSIADQHGFPHGIVARAELNLKSVQTVLEQHCEHPNMRGIRHIVNWHADPAKTFVQRADLLRDPDWLSGFGLLQRFNLSFDLQLYPSQFADAVVLAQRYPDTTIILNHAGMPVDRGEEAYTYWREGMRRLAAQRNIWVKISGLGMVDWKWTEASIRPYVLDTIDCFGVDRCMFASNFPVDKLYSSFATLYGAFRSIVRSFEEHEQRKLFGETAAKVYRL